MVKRSADLWILPGGYADVGFDPIQNAEREVKEETGLDVQVVSLAGVYDSTRGDFPTLGRQVYTMVFYARLLGGNLQRDPEEVLDVAFFNLGSLPRIPLVTRSQIEHGFRLFQGETPPPVIGH